MKIRFAFLLLLVGSLATVSSCSKRSLSALNPCTINGVVQNVPVNPQRALDLLIVIDDSPSMRDEQEKLQQQVPRLVNLLITGGAAEPGAVGEFPAVESLHVGIITPDLGHSIPSDDPSDVGHDFTAGPDPTDDFNPTTACERSGGLGLAGNMQTEGLSGTPREPCMAITPPAGTQYLNYPEQGFDATDLIDDVTCVTGQDDGCGFEQQLEAILKSDRAPGNAGFSREDALLAVILITDEDDCSTTDPRVFDVEDRESNPFQGPLTSMDQLQFNLRCWAHSQALQDVQRYVEGIAALKSDPSQVVFAAITGIPEEEDLNCDAAVTEAERYACILDEEQTPEMREVPNPANDDEQTQQLTPACDAGVAGVAFPARRIVETMQGLAETNTGVGTVVSSICADDYAPALNAIVDRIAAALRQLCLPRPLNRDSSGMVGCEVREVQPAGQTCAEAESRGREPIPVGEEDGREVCRVQQLPSDAGVPAGLGWFYDDFTAETEAACSFNPEQQRVSFTEGAAPVSGARIRFECLQAAPPATQDIGWPCAVDTDCNPDPANCIMVCDGDSSNVGNGCSGNDECDGGSCIPESLEQCEERILRERYDRDGLMLVCDDASGTCQLTCENDSQCPGGFVCYDPSDDGVDNPYCVNPTCSLN